MKNMIDKIGGSALVRPFHASTVGALQGWALSTGSDRKRGTRPATGGRLRGYRATELTLAPDSVVRGQAI